MPLRDLPCANWYDKHLAEDFKDYKVLWLYSCGPGQFHSGGKPITRLEDLKGSKMRSPSAYMSKALQLMGANAVSMPISELTVSLQKGVIDGMLTPFSALADFKCFELVKYLAELDFYVSPMAVVMNKEKFDSLPNEAKKALDQAFEALEAFIYDHGEVGLLVMQFHRQGHKDTAPRKILRVGQITIPVVCQNLFEFVQRPLAAVQT